MIRVIVAGNAEQDAVAAAAMDRGLRLFAGQPYQVIRETGDGRERLAGTQTPQWTEVEYPAQGDTGPGCAEPAMTTYQFAVLIGTPGGRGLTEAEIGALYEAGLSDAAVETGSGYSLADFDREAPARGEAVASALADIRKVPDLRPVLVIEGGQLTAVTPQAAG